jgi:GNAT superfamily N-acetyltransferase
MPAVVVRTATMIDAPCIAALLRASIVQLCAADHDYRDAPLREWLANKTTPIVETWVSNPSNVMLVAEVGNTMAGVGCLRTDGYIALNYVSPDHRFLGVSKAMLAALEDQARGLALTMVRLESTKTAIKFYRASGFDDAGTPITKNGLPAYPMIKHLQAANGP